MIKKGDSVIFRIGQDTTTYTALTDEYERDGKQVVDLEDYDGEVNVEYLIEVPF